MAAIHALHKRMEMVTHRQWLWNFILTSP